MKRSVVFVFLMMVFLLSACSAQGEQTLISSEAASQEEQSNAALSETEPSQTESSEEESSGMPVGTDYTVKGDFKEYSDSEIAQKNIILVNSYLNFAYGVPDLAALVSSSSEAVEFTVDEIKYAFLNGSGYTVCNVTVTRSFSGNLREGDKISILQYGGYFSIEEETEYWQDEERFSGMTEEERENSLIKSHTDAGVDYHVGDVFVAFIGRDDGFYEGAYFSVNMGEGVFTFSDPETLVRCCGENYEQNELRISDLLTIGTGIEL